MDARSRIARDTTAYRLAVVSAIVLLCSVHAVIAVPARYVLESSDLRVIIDLETGRIAEIQDLRTPNSLQVFAADERVLEIAAGDFRPVGFLVVESNAASISLSSSTFQNQDSTLSLGTAIQYRLAGNRLAVDYGFEAGERLDLVEGLDIRISSSVWAAIEIRNHFTGEDPIDVSRPPVVRHFALNQAYELQNSLRNLRLVFANPYHSLVTVATTTPDSFEFSWHVLAAIEPFKAVDPVGPPLASVLIPGVRLHRQIEMAVGHDDETRGGLPSPIACFSPFPNGYDQVIAMTFDDIPFGTYTVPTSGHNPNDPVQQYLIRLLEDHPRMKMGWVVLPDVIFTEAHLANPDYPPGKWWLAHSKYRMLDMAPPEYLEWLRCIDRDSVVYGYEDRVRLGNHGYHHTAEMDFAARSFEFQSYDPIGHDSTFATVCKEYSLLGLSEKSRRWIRFPGFTFTRSTVDALIKHGFILFDYWGIRDRLPWMLFYSEHGRIWGLGTQWEGDTPSPYDVMDALLRAGKLCHTSGHPHAWFDGDGEWTYQGIHRQFQQAEMDFPHLGYMFPDEVGFFADETYDIRDIQTEMTCDGMLFSFVGAATSGQTVMVEWPDSIPLPDSVAVDGEEIPGPETRGRRLVVRLPRLADGPHVVRISPVVAGPCEAKVPPPDLVLFQNHPNPFNSGTVIVYDLPRAAHVTLAVYGVRGERLVTLVDEQQPPDTYTVEWDGRDGSGKPLASGVYFYRLEAGDLRRVRKMTVVR